MALKYLANCPLRVRSNLKFSCRCMVGMGHLYRETLKSTRSSRQERAYSCTSILGAVIWVLVNLAAFVRRCVEVSQA